MYDMIFVDKEIPSVEQRYPHRISKVSAHLPNGDLPEPGDKSVLRNGLMEILEIVL